MANKQMSVHQVTAVQSKTFTGPIPSPEYLAQYERILPGTAERILAMAEQQAASRQDLERKNYDIVAKDTEAARTETKRSQWMSLVITLSAFAGAVYCAKIGQPWVAGCLAGTTLLGIVSTFLNRKEK